MARKKKTGVCAYCGSISEVTTDHVIPRCLYDGNVPQDVPRVTACYTCNNDEKSKDDSFLRDVLITDWHGSRHPIAQAIFRDAFARSVRRDKSEGARQALRATPVALTTPGGIIHDLAYIAPPEASERIDTIMARTVRGLYAAYVGGILPKASTFDVIRVRRSHVPVAALNALLQNGEARKVRVGDGEVFACLYAYDSARPEVSSWILSFYRGVSMGVATNGAPQICEGGPWVALQEQNT